MGIREWIFGKKKYVQEEPVEEIKFKRTKRSKYSMETVLKLREMKELGSSIKDMSKETGVPMGTICYLLDRTR